MIQTLRQVRSFPWTVRILLVNQLTINIGFYMLMPYLATYLAGTLGLATWLVGFILGVRNLSQQGMFLLGGSLADRLGYKPMILTGLTLRTLGFALLAVVDTVPTLIAASALTGLAGAFFNPAIRAYLAHEAADRRVEAFAVFNVFYQAGILLGPLIGLALVTVDFRAACAIAAVVFAALALAQLPFLPSRSGGNASSTTSLLADWRTVLGNRPFLLFSLAMIGSYVLNFQVYLGLPIQVRQATGGELGVTAVFVLSGLLTVAGQLRVTAWAKARWTSGQAITRGLTLMGLSFLPLAITAHLEPPDLTSSGPTVVLALLGALAPVFLSTALLTTATMLVYPFEMDTIVTLGGQRMVGTYYGLYNTLAGIGIAAGNLLTGAAIDTAHAIGLPALPWTLLTLTGLGCALALHRLNRTGRMKSPTPTLPQTADPATRTPP